MSVMNKPDYKIFAQDAKSGEYVAFPDILRGWGITLEQYNGFPPMELFNSAAKRIDEWLMYLTQRGLPEWDAVVDYPKDAMIQHAGVYYVSLKATKGEQPNNSQASWKKLTEVLGVDGKLAKDQNGADIPNKETFIKNLGLPEKFQEVGYSYSKKESDDNFQPKGKYASSEIFNTPGNGYTYMNSPAKKYRAVIGDNGEFAVINGENPLNPSTFSFDKNGIMQNGVVPATRVTGLFSKYLAVAGDRVIGTTYTNSNDKPMFIIISFGNYNGSMSIYVNDEIVYETGNTSNGITRVSAFFMVPPRGTYRVGAGSIAFEKWTECV